ncbi:NTP transferase domain-containing protein [Novosphingobium sp.]|uniref:NTP transferase domain-containing protein n=1 Tax=Novosphingobium sp. TaxID=1874826 RepID=UPI003BA9FF6E
MSPPATDTGFAGLALVLLAGGQSARFGGPKLVAPLGGKALALHAAEMLAALPFAARYAVIGPNAPDLAALGYSCVALTPPGAAQARSLALGVAAAHAGGAQAVLVALADMPLVPEAHVRSLVEAFDGDRIATTAGGVTMPPALFGAAHFAALTALDGDHGGAVRLKGAPTVPLDPLLALDVDRPEDLARAEALLR